jgi:hypothetical protein
MNKDKIVIWVLTVLSLGLGLALVLYHVKVRSLWTMSTCAQNYKTCQARCKKKFKHLGPYACLSICSFKRSSCCYDSEKTMKKCIDDGIWPGKSTLLGDER